MDNSKCILYCYLLCFVFNFDQSVSFSVEELEWVNYKVDILETPVKKGMDLSQSTMHMTSKYGQEYQCFLEESKDNYVSETEIINERNTEIKQLLKPMQHTPCLLKRNDWWTYEFCFGHYIKQFHIEDGQIIGPIITLGLFESDYDWNNETDLVKHKQIEKKYHSQYYTNGTNCDLTGQPREAEVRFYCEKDAEDYIYHVDEIGSCSYIITIHSSRLCFHPQLKPIPSNKAYSILCHPLLNEEQYSQYLNKFKEDLILLNDDEDQSQSAVLYDDYLHVHMKRLGRKSTDSSSKLYKMDVAQKKKLEQAVNEKLENTGLKEQGIEMNIISAGFYDNEDGKDLALSDEEIDQFQNMIMAFLTGQQEAILEMERHNKLEENYRFTWENDDNRVD